MNDTVFDIIVVGGGLVGAAAALALHRQGKQVALLELQTPLEDTAALTQNWDARIYAISPANQAFLHSLDAWPDMSRIQPVQRMDVRGDQGGRIVFQAAELHQPHLTCIAENRWLLAALWRQIRHRGITVLHERALAVRTTVQAAYLDLADGRSLQAQLLIGADGAQSWLRAQTDINVRQDPYHHHGVVANFHTEKDHQGTAFQWFKHGEVLAYLPLPDHKISIVWSSAAPEKLTQLAPDALAAAVAAQGEHVLGDLQPLGRAFAFELILRRPHTTVAQRIALIGDAAHTIHPLAGQGVNLGFGDVQTLARLLEHAADAGAWQLLKRYAQQRLEPVRSMQMGCDALFKLFAESQLPGLPWLRNSGLSLTNSLPAVKNRLIRHAMGF